MCEVSAGLPPIALVASTVLPPPALDQADIFSHLLLLLPRLALFKQVIELAVQTLKLFPLPLNSNRHLVHLPMLFPPSTTSLTSPLLSPSLKCKTPLSTLAWQIYHVERLTLEKKSQYLECLITLLTGEPNGRLYEATHNPQWACRSPPLPSPDSTKHFLHLGQSLPHLDH